MVEEEMEFGNDFESSYRTIMTSIGETRLSGLQHETILLLDKKFQRMKRITYLVGLLGSLTAITGSFFKMFHWPGASIMLTLGFFIVVAIFLPAYFIMSYREQEEKPNIIFPIVGYLSLFLIFTGAVFKVMHWPGANIALKVSLVFILVGFLPLYIVQIFKRSSQTKINPAYIIMVLVGLSIVLILTRINLSKDAIDRYTEITLLYQESIELLDQKNADFLNEYGDSLGEQAMKIKQYTNELCAMADHMTEGLLVGIDQAGIPIEQAAGRDFRNAARDAFIDNGLGDKFKELSREYEKYLLQIVTDPLVKNQVELGLMYSSDRFIIGWMPQDYADEPLILSYMKIIGLKRQIVQVEEIVLASLLN